MRRSTRSLLALGACLVLFALPGAAQAARAAKLLAKYQPVTYFSAGERFRPTTVESFVEDSNLEAFNPLTGQSFLLDPNPDADSLPTSGPGLLRLNQRDCTPADGSAGAACAAAEWSAHGAPGTVYGRVLRTPDHVIVQYWYFYYDDFYPYAPAAPDFIWQAHEGDWEVVNVVLSEDEEPLYVGYSQHCLGQRRSWSKTPRWRGHHPVVYVALGSHANYFSTGSHPFNQACLPASVLGFFQQANLPLPDDHTGNAAAAGPAIFGAESTQVRRVTASSPSWIAFPGTWGELEYLHAPAPIGTQPFGLAPFGPAFHAVWQTPVATLATWPGG